MGGRWRSASAPTGGAAGRLGSGGQVAAFSAFYFGLYWLKFVGVYSLHR